MSRVSNGESRRGSGKSERRRGAAGVGGEQEEDSKGKKDGSGDSELARPKSSRNCREARASGGKKPLLHDGPIGPQRRQLRVSKALAALPCYTLQGISP